MKLNFPAPWRICAHRFVAISRKEKMAMVRRNNRVLDTGSCKLSNCPREIVDDGVHYLPGLERESCLPSVVDLLRANHDDLRPVDLLCEPRGLKAQEFV